MSETVRKVKTSITSVDGWLSGTMEYEVLSDSYSGASYSDINAILSANGLPSYRDTVGSTRARGYIQSVQAQRSGSDRINGKYKWTVIATVGHASGNQEAGEVTSTASVSRSSEVMQRVRAADVNDVVNMNSVGDMYEDGLVQQVPIPVWTFSLKLTFNPECWAKWEKNINDSPLWGYDTGQLLFDSLSYNHDYINSEWDTSVVIKANPFGWNVLKADAGYYYLYNGYPVRILNDDGSPKETPTLLNGMGGISNVAVYKEFQNQPAFNMALLGLPRPTPSAS
ncbi:MAG: hypothetical protein IJH68_00600 [Thermoguttaceae bacterium]|nr:hypothetical protein [Thermoguttaceae bacterium]